LQPPVFSCQTRQRVGMDSAVAVAVAVAVANAAWRQRRKGWSLGH
jgi:hypothetical protein